LASHERFWLMLAEPDLAAMKLFQRVWGIGPHTARHLVACGFRTLADLDRNRHRLNPAQQVGLRLFEDLERRMSRDEVSQLYEIVSHSPRVFLLTLAEVDMRENI
jgi:hypothetical protein